MVGPINNKVYENKICFHKWMYTITTGWTKKKIEHISMGRMEYTKLKKYEYGHANNIMVSPVFTVADDLRGCSMTFFFIYMCWVYL